MRPEQHVIDEIDALVSESIASGPVDDYEVNRYVKCPGCHGDWHGMPKPGCTGGDEPEKCSGSGGGGGRVADAVAFTTGGGGGGGGIPGVWNPSYMYHTDTGVVLIPDGFVRMHQRNPLEGNGLQFIGYIDEDGLTRGES